MPDAIHRYVYKVGSIQQLGGQDVVNLNYYQVPFLASAVTDIVSGTASYAIEFTTDEIGGNPANFRWLTIPNLNNQTASQQFSLAFPVTAIRINLASLTGEVRFTVIQAPGSL